MADPSWGRRKVSRHRRKKGRSQLESRASQQRASVVHSAESREGVLGSLPPGHLPSQSRGRTKKDAQKRGLGVTLESALSKGGDVADVSAALQRALREKSEQKAGGREQQPGLEIFRNL